MLLEFHFFVRFIKKEFEMQLADEKALFFVFWKLYAKRGNKNNIFKVETLKDFLSEQERNNLPEYEPSDSLYKSAEIWQQSREKIFSFLDTLRVIFNCDISFEHLPDFEKEINWGISTSIYPLEIYAKIFEQLNNINADKTFNSLFEDPISYRNIILQSEPLSNKCPNFEYYNEFDEGKEFQGSADRHFLNDCFCTITIDDNELKQSLDKYIKVFNDNCLDDSYQPLEKQTQYMKNFISNNKKISANPNFIKLDFGNEKRKNKNFRIFEMLINLINKQEIEISNIEFISKYDEMTANIIFLINHKNIRVANDSDTDYNIYIKENEQGQIKSVMCAEIELCKKGYLTDKKLGIFNQILNKYPKAILETDLEYKNDTAKSLSSTICRINKFFKEIFINYPSLNDTNLITRLKNYEEKEEAVTYEINHEFWDLLTFIEE